MKQTTNNPFNVLNDRIDEKGEKEMMHFQNNQGEEMMSAKLQSNQLNNMNVQESMEKEIGMKVISQKVVKASCLSVAMASAMMSSGAWAQEASPNADKPASKVEPGNQFAENFLVGAYVGSDSAMRLKVGIGGLGEKNDWSSVALTYFKTDSDLSINGVGIDMGEYSSIRLAIDSNGFRSNTPYSGGMFLYKNKLERGIIDKYGVGFALGGGFAMGNKTKLNAQVELMPQFLSTDWDDKVYLQYTGKLEGHYLVTKSVKAHVAYEYGGMLLDENSYKLYSNVGAGVEVAF
jgi:hypothetical protein